MAESLLDHPAAATSPAQHDAGYDTGRWLAVLDVLERSLDDAERLLTDPTTTAAGRTAAAVDGWRRPTGGPVSAGVPVPGVPGAGAPGRAAPDRSPWSPPTGLGPLPPYLTGRVQRLVTRQRATAALLEAARGTTARHLTAVRAAQPGAGAPTYVDVSG